MTATRRRLVLGFLCALIGLSAAPPAVVGAPPGDAAPSSPSCGGRAATVAAPAPAIAPSLPTPRPAASPAKAPILHTVANIPLPGGASRFDYQSLDEKSSRLYIAHMAAGQVIAFDLKTDRVVGTVGGLPGVTGVLAVPELGRVYAAVTGDHQVAVLDARTLNVVARVGKIDFPDGLDYAPAVGRVFVSDESGGGELVLDARASRVVTTIAVGGEAGNTHYDPVSGCVVVAAQTRDQLVFINPATDRVVARDDLDAGCRGPHGFSLDAPRRLVFVTCEDNAQLLVVDLRTMRMTATHPVGDSPDVLAFDPGWRRLYVASESGEVTVFAERGADVQPIGTLAMPHAHSIAVDPRTHRVYVPLADVGGRPVLRIMAGPAPGA